MRQQPFNAAINKPTFFPIDDLTRLTHNAACEEYWDIFAMIHILSSLAGETQWPISQAHQIKQTKETVLLRLLVVLNVQ